MKFTISYSRKVKTDKAYEMMEIFASLESDTSIEDMESAFKRVRDFVDSKIDTERYRLLQKEVNNQK